MFSKITQGSRFVWAHWPRPLLPTPLFMVLGLVLGGGWASMIILMGAVILGLSAKVAPLLVSIPATLILVLGGAFYGSLGIHGGWTGGVMLPSAFIIEMGILMAWSKLPDIEDDPTPEEASRGKGGAGRPLKVKRQSPHAH